MRIATWNINSIRARLPRVLDWLRAQAPDVVCFQEIKCQDEQFPTEAIEELGYNVAVFGQKSYNGVAILSKSPLEDVRRGLPDDSEDAERRVIAANTGDVMLLNVYVVNGQSVGSARYAFKLQWLARLAQYVRDEFPTDEKVVLMGDFNVTFDDRDVYDPERWRERILCSTPEREALQGVLDVGLHDALRKFHEQGGLYTWWDYRTRGFERGNGLRIDHFLMSEPALEAFTGVEVDLDARKGAKPSDHAPVIATLR